MEGWPEDGLVLEVVELGASSLSCLFLRTRGLWSRGQASAGHQDGSPRVPSQGKEAHLLPPESRLALAGLIAPGHSRSAWEDDTYPLRQPEPRVGAQGGGTEAPGDSTPTAPALLLTPERHGQSVAVLNLDSNISLAGFLKGWDDLCHVKAPSTVPGTENILGKCFSPQRALSCVLDTQGD